jgi:hypothetical protein
MATFGLIAIFPCLRAQQTYKPYTLHVYTRRIQVPTLVLTSDLKPVPPILRINFRISIDGGPPFLPTNMHMEGDDPLDIAILLDASGSEDALLKDFANSVASLAPADLHPQDHFAIYAVDCDLISSPPNVPVSAPALHSAIVNALAFPTLHGKHAHPACAGKVPLWDSATHAIKELSTLPGRRVLLIVSTGSGDKSHITWNTLNQYANLQSVTVFGMNDFFNSQSSADDTMQSMRDGVHSIPHLSEDIDPLKTLCQTNGGALFATEPQNLTRDLQTLIRMLRGRYILSFPEASKFEPGTHGITITVAHKPDLFITTTGVIVDAPLNDSILNDPTTVPSAPSPVTYGTHKPPQSN